MPEGLEAEIWRRAAEPIVGRTIIGGRIDDRVAPPGLLDEIVGGRVAAVRRVGKVLLFDLGGGQDGRGGHALGLHFGMTGRLVIDGRAPIDQLEYASSRDDPAWDRLLLHTSPPGTETGDPAVRMNDPRRLGRITLDADLSHLGVDIFRVTASRLVPVLARRRIAVKSALLDQSVVAGLGNLLADEVLWHSAIDPRRPADSLDPAELAALARAVRRRLPVMLRRGGSTTGVLTPDVRAQCPPCPRDGGPLRRDQIGNRTTVWCPRHQQ